jgi:hypothetical protein
MLRYVLALTALLAIEAVVLSTVVDFTFDYVSSESATATLYVFGGPVTVIVMGLTIAVFEAWRRRVADQNRFRASHG